MQFLWNVNQPVSLGHINKMKMRKLDTAIHFFSIWCEKYVDCHWLSKIHRTQLSLVQTGISKVSRVENDCWDPAPKYFPVRKLAVFAMPETLQGNTDLICTKRKPSSLNNYFVSASVMRRLPSLVCQRIATNSNRHAANVTPHPLWLIFHVISGDKRQFAEFGVWSDWWRRLLNGRTGVNVEKQWTYCTYELAFFNIGTIRKRKLKLAYRHSRPALSSWQLCAEGLKF